MVAPKMGAPFMGKWPASGYAKTRETGRKAMVYQKEFTKRSQNHTKANRCYS